MKIEIANITLNLLGLVFCTLIIFVASTGKYFGKFLSFLIKCNERPESSFPCYGIYDIWIMIIFGLLGLYFLTKIILYFFSFFLNK